MRNFNQLNVNADAEQPRPDVPLSTEQAQLFTRVRRLMLLSGLATVLGIAIVLTVVGYRISRSGGRPADVTETLPRGTKVVSTALAGDRIIVTLDMGTGTEIRTYDAATLRLQGRLRFLVEP
jgi:hypothetical protein